METYSIKITKEEMSVLFNSMMSFEEEVITAKEKGRISSEKLQSIETILVNIAEKFANVANITLEKT